MRAPEPSTAELLGAGAEAAEEILGGVFRIEKALDGSVPEAKVKQGLGADMFLMHQWIKNEPVDLLIGNSDGDDMDEDDEMEL